MPNITTQAIVLRYADYREHDRMLTLLSPTLGRIDAVSRGCKSVKSPLLPCSECFAFGEYVFYTGKGHCSVVSCSLTESFYDIRSDYEKLRYGTYMLACAETAAQPGDEAGALFLLLVKSLTRLCYSAHDPEAVTAAFLAHFNAVSGYSPVLDHCVRCAREYDRTQRWLFDTENGGLVCETCADAFSGDGNPVTDAQISWLRDVLKIGIDKTSCPESDAPGLILARYTEKHLERNINRKGLF